MQDVDLSSEFGCFLIELMEVSDLPSQPSVIEVADVALQVYKVAGGPNEEGAEPSGERFNGVVFAMPSRVSFHI